MLHWQSMSHEHYYQANLFTGDLVDTRTRIQKRRARQSAIPRQLEMFSQRELAQFGVNPRPKLPLSPKTRLELALEDARTEREQGQARQRQIEQLTYPLPWAHGLLETMAMAEVAL